MTDTTFDEARRCPTCNELGTASGQRRIVPDRKKGLAGGTMHIFVCKNERCKRKDREWVVQTRPDGTVPTPSLNREKSFPAVPGVSNRQRIEAARSYADSFQNGAEIRRA